MARYLLCLVICVAVCSAATHTVPSYVQPQQIHLSYGGDPSKMFVTWVTLDAISQNPIVEYGDGPAFLDSTATGTTTIFHAQIDDAGVYRLIYVHRVLLENLTPGRTYMYHAGCQDGWSAIYFFRALKLRVEGYKYAVYGDMGNWNARSLGNLQQEAQRGHFDMILHVGDLAYDLVSANATIGDQFMRQIEPIAAYLPYMTVPGNHENAYNFTHYVNRFTMPGGSASLFYSFDLGPAHFIGFSTEFYFYTGYGTKQVENQFRWLQNDLLKANQNRKNVPWIVTMAHRPMYCSNADSDDCTKYEGVTRTGGKQFGNYSLEKLFYKYGVDLTIWAHEHSYERLWPVYNRTVYNGTKHPYTDPPVPVHIITGSAGCQEDTDAFTKVPPPWSAFRSSDYGYARMTISNMTHLYFEQFSDNTNKVIDSIWLIKNHHGPYLETIRKQHTGIYIPYDFHNPNEKKCKECSDL